MKITSMLKSLILEASRFSVLYDKWVKPKTKKVEGGKEPKGIMSFDTLKEIIFADPTTKYPEGIDKDSVTVEDMESERVKVGAYTQWLINNFVSPKESDFSFEGERDSKNPEYRKARAEFERLFLEDLYKQTERLEFFTKVKQYLPQEKKDIGKLSVSDLFDIYSNFQLPEKKKKEQEKKLAKKTREGFKHAGGKILFEGNDWVLIRIDNCGETCKDAAIYYGGYKDHRNGESDWCTSSPGLTFYDGYIKNGPLYVVFPQNDKGEVGSRTGLPKERYQFHFPSNQYMDRDDHQIDLVKFLNGPMSELKDFFKEEFAKGLTTQNGKKVEISYPRDTASKYIALYGMEDLINNLPETLDEFIFKNTDSSADFSFPIPDSISRFKSLSILMLQNCINSVPNSISGCKSLSMISLPNNKNLKTIPESIADLNDLSFLNIKGCDPKLVSGDTIPPRLKEKLVESDSTDPSEKGFFYVM